MTSISGLFNIPFVPSLYSFVVQFAIKSTASLFTFKIFLLTPLRNMYSCFTKGNVAVWGCSSLSGQVLKYSRTPEINTSPLFAGSPR